MEQKQNTVLGRDSRLEYWNAFTRFCCFRLHMNPIPRPHYKTISMVNEMTMTIPMMMMQTTRKVK